MNCLTVEKSIFYIETARSCYAFSVEKGYAEHLYYGAKIPFSDIDVLKEKRSVILVNALYPADDPTYSFDCKGFEFSMPCRGDSRSASLCLVCDDIPFDFVYDGYEVNPAIDSPMPVPLKYDSAVKVSFKDMAHGSMLNLYYLVCYDCDVIIRFCEFVNNGERTEILKFASSQTDMPATNKKLATFHGAWGRETEKREQFLTTGIYRHGSFSGMSSAECNPLFFVSDCDAGENHGEVFGFNLMYSASHEISAEVTPYGGLRIINGIQSENLRYTLEKGENFIAPCSVMTYSACGFNKASRNLHDFVRCAVSPIKEIPVMLNTWEAVYFDMNEDKMKSLADKASQCGFECLVIDDGWFGERNDDTNSLGDWYENKKKFPHGLKEISSYFNNIGLKTGIWIEPEMISENSNLYRNNPEFALKCDEIRHVVGRGQYILDMTDEKVRKHVEDSVARLAEEYGASYVKWDFNRRFADIKASKGSGYYYDYVKGLYSVLKNLNRRFPSLIIENCASGGGRFDLGMARYTACGWASDNTNPLSRAKIQQGVSYGYPLSFTLNHVAESPGHQTVRTSTLKDRINTAYLGVFGVQADITKMKEEELEFLAKAVDSYKKHRREIMSSEVYRISAGNDGYRITQTMSRNAESGFLYLMREKFDTVTQLPVIRLRGLKKGAEYRVYGQGVDVIAYAETFENAGLVLPQNYQGAGREKDTLMITDGGTLLLRIKIKE